MENHKIIGVDVGWLPDFKMSRDSELKWTVTQTYKAKESRWYPPRFPQLSIAPQVPLYDYEVSKSKGYYFYAITWKLRDNEVTNEEDEDLPEEEQQTGREQDESEEINTFNFQRGLTTIPLHEHKLFKNEDGEEFKRVYDLCLSGRLLGFLSDEVIIRPDIKDRSITAEEAQKIKTTIDNPKFDTYKELRGEGIENVLVPESSYTIVKADNIKGNPNSNPLLSAFKEQSIALDGNVFAETSRTSTVDEMGNNVTTTNYSNKKLT